MESRNESRPPEDEDRGRGRHEQVRSRERVRDLAEVYTHEREVNAMLDLVPDMFPSDDAPGNTDCTFLEPACGSGNFLVEILRRKLAHVTPSRYGRGERFEYRILCSLASIYGIDISDDNVRESRERLMAVIAAHLEQHVGTKASTSGFRTAGEAILSTNIIRADTLADASGIVLVEYVPGSGGTFTREWSRPLDESGAESRLFSLAPSRHDEAPVHYSELGANPSPVTVDTPEMKAA